MTSCVTTSQQNARNGASNGNMWTVYSVLMQNEREQQIRTQNTLNNWGGRDVDSSLNINRGYQNVIPVNNMFGVQNE